MCRYIRSTFVGPIPCDSSGNLGCGGYCVSHCPTGLMVTEEFKKLASVDELTLASMDKIHRHYDSHFVDEHGCIPYGKTSHVGNGAYVGKFAFTLTKSDSDELSEEDMIKAVRKIMSQKSCPVKEYAWYLEYGDPELKKHPHIHGMYETESSGRIEAKHFKRAWKIWDEKHKLGKGFRGGYHRPVRDREAYSDYIRKDGGLNEFYFSPESIDGR